jgi:hypothetical protein
MFVPDFVMSVSYDTGHAIGKEDSAIRYWRPAALIGRLAVAVSCRQSDLSYNRSLALLKRPAYQVLVADDHLIHDWISVAIPIPKFIPVLDLDRELHGMGVSPTLVLGKRSPLADDGLFRIVFAYPHHTRCSALRADDDNHRR